MNSLQKRVAYVMSISAEQLRDMVPRQSGIRFTDCPNCETGAQDRADWEWTPQAPRQIKCKGCGAVYPNNPKYPDDKFIEVAAPEGTHRYHYYEREDGYRIFFRAAADDLARVYLVERCRDLARLYATTKDEKYACGAAIILVRFAEVYPTWAYRFDFPFSQKKFAPYNQNRIPDFDPSRVCRWRSGWCWSASMDISFELLETYDILKSWPGLDRMAGGGARRMIEEDLLTAMVEFVMGFRETNNNMAPRMWRDFVYAGRVLERPEWVQEALKRLDTFMEEHFLYDGHWKETAPSYCSQVAGQLRMVTRVLSGYTPPESAPADLAAAFKKTLARTRAGIKALESAVASTRMPHGGFVTINDTWARPRKTRTDTKPLLLPGLGLAVLGGGEDHRQMYAWLNYTSGWEHKHYDALSLGLFAHGHELLRDIGYTHTRWRSWVSCTASHNTVVVDGVNSGHNRDHAKHRLRVFATDGKGFHLTEAESDTAYPDTAGRYRRTLVCVGENATDAYLIDVFQVHGGNQHDYLLHGTAAEDSTAKVDGVRLQPFTGSLMNPGATFESPQGERDVTEAGAEYGFVRNLTSGAATGGVRLDLRLSSDQKIGTRTHLVAQEGDTVYLGEAPRIRQAEHHDDLLKNYYAPFFCLRRRGENLSSTFVAVHEPVNGRAKVRGITTTELDGALLIAIQRGESGMDYFLMALDDTSVSVAARAGEAELRFEGRWGLARTRNGKASALHTIDANVLALNGTGIEGIPAYQGSVRAVDRGATAEGGSRGSFVVAETIAADAKFGALLIEFADTTVRGYNITRIEPLADGTRLHVAEDPALEVRDDTVLLTSYPQRTIAGGTVRYRLPVVGSLRCPSTPSRNSTYE